MKLPEPRYQRFDSEYRKFIKKLLKRKGSDLQRNFLEALKSNERCVSYIKDNVEIKEGGKTLPLIDRDLTRNEFIDRPLSIKNKIFIAWSELYPAEACLDTFWGCVTLQHIEAGRIQADFLVEETHGNNSLECINRTLQENDGVKIDRIVRTAIRRASGLQQASGRKSVYSDCAFASAWWQMYIAEEIYNETGREVSLDSIIKVLTISKRYWEKLISVVVSQNSIVGDSKVRTALVWALSNQLKQLKDDGKNKPLFKTAGIEKISKLIGVRCAWQELGVFKTDELRAMIEKEIFPVILDESQ